MVAPLGTDWNVPTPDDFDKVHVIGSGPHCDVIIQDDPGVLPEHIRITNDGGMWSATAVDLAWENRILPKWGEGGPSILTAIRVEYLQLAQVELIGIGEHTWIDWRSIVYGTPLRLVQK